MPAGSSVIIILRPPDVAGPLRTGATGHDTVNTLRQLGEPVILCGTAGRPAGWGVDRPSGLFIATYFDADNRVEAIEFGRVGGHTTDTITYNELDVFATPAADVVMQLRHHTTVHEEEDGHAFIAPDLFLAFWRSTTLETPDDEDGRFFGSLLLARPAPLHCVVAGCVEPAVGSGSDCPGELGERHDEP
jgi:hypothetical protein